MTDVPVKIIIPEGNKKYIFNANEIKFIKADRYYMNIMCMGKKVLVRITMKKLEQLLPSYFLRINKSVIVNMIFAIRIEESKSSCCIVLSNEIEHQVTEIYRPTVDSYLFYK